MSQATFNECNRIQENMHHVLASLRMFPAASQELVLMAQRLDRGLRVLSNELRDAWSLELQEVSV